MTGTAGRCLRARLVKALLAVGAASLSLTVGLPSAGAETPPYTLPVSLPSSIASPSFDAAAPYTPAVLSLIAQLEPTGSPTLAQVQNFTTLLRDGASPDCHNVGPVGRPFGLDAAGNVAGTTLAAAAAAGATNVKVTSVTPFSVGQTIWLDATSEAEQATITAVGTAGSAGTGLDLAAPLVRAHANGRPAYVSLTTPSISYICWTDAQGVLNTSGPNARGSTAPMTLMGLAATFDRGLANAWGQTEGAESRAFMVTGMFGPQTDLARLPNWGRNLTVTGEDPYLSYELVAEQIHGIQGVGAMSEMKHFVVYNGQNQNANTDIQDQGLHELYLTPYEGGFVAARAAATMCSYQIWRDVSTNPALVDPISALSTTSPLSPFAKPGENPLTWPLNESHFSCEHPLALTHVLHDTWGTQAMVGSDYPATHSTSGILQGEDQEMPTQNGFFAGGNGTNDPTGSTCAYFTGNPGGFTAGFWDPGCTSNSSHVGGIPNGFQGGNAAAGCAVPANATAAGGCTLNAAVANGVLPLSVVNQSLARILYEEERFGMLGCDPVPTASCTNPGGVGADRSGTAQLPTGGDGQLGTKVGDAAIVERYSEEGATLLKNDDHALPLTGADLAGGILVTGANANHTVADPTNEASTGFIGRNAINPLQQLKDFSGNPGAITFVPANDPDGKPIPPSVLSTTPDAGGLGGLNLSIDGGPPAKDTSPIDHTAVNGNRLAPGHTYTWSGYLYVPASDTYTFGEIQQSDTLPTTLNCPQTGQFGTPSTTPTLTLCSPFTAGNQSQTSTPPDAVRFSFNGAQRNLNAVTANVYGATVPSNPTNAGYTDQGLISRTCATGTTVIEPGTVNCTATESSLTGGTFYPISFTADNAANCVSTPAAAAAGANPAVPAVIAPCTPASFRLAYTRAAGDISDAAAAAVGNSKAIVFVNDSDAIGTTANPDGTPTTISAVRQLSTASVNLITAVAAANPNTIVVVNNQNPFVTPWLGNVKSLLAMWFAGQEGGTSTARILLGRANPSGHTAMTWPLNTTDTIWAYDEPANGLYPGSAAGRHPERLNGNGGCSPAASCAIPAGATIESEGIYTGYRYFDKLGIAPRFPFGFGLSYTTFAFSNLKVKQTDDGGADVSFTLRNTGAVAGADAVQVYVGAPSDAPAGVQVAVRSLAQFDRVEVAAGQSKDVTLHVPARQLSYWSDAKQEWVLDAAGRTVYVGDADAAANLPLQATLKAASKNLTCEDTQLNATTIEGNLTVPKGAWCDLVRVNVRGNLHVQRSGGIRIADVTVGGNLEVNNTSGGGDLMSSGANVICNSTIKGNLHVQNSASGAPWRLGGCGPNSVGGNLHFQNNAGTGNAISHTTVKGNLQCQGNADVAGGSNTVGGNRQGQCAGL